MKTSPILFKRSLHRPTCILIATAILFATSATGQNYTFAPFAGHSGVGSDDGVGANAHFQQLYGVAIDGNGSAIVTDVESCTIRSVTASGVVTTIAGMAGVCATADGMRGVARFRGPTSVARDASGNLYLTDFDTIRKITPAGAVSTLAGLAGTTGSADGTGSAARFNEPRGILADANGDLYVADTLNSTIRKVTSAGVVTTLAGAAGVYAFANGSGSSARFNAPVGLTFDSAGNIMVADWFNHRIRKVTSNGDVTTFAGSGTADTIDGSGTGASFIYPLGIARDSAGNFFVMEDRTLRKITPDGVVTTFAGSPYGPGGIDDGNGGTARFDLGAHLAIDSSDTLYLSDLSRVRRITPSADVTTIAGSLERMQYLDGTGTAARFSQILSVATDGSGNIYAVDFFYSRIRKITPSAVVTTLAGSEFAGSADGTGTNASFRLPRGIAADSSGNIYVADTGNSTIRKITPAGIATTLAGSARHDGFSNGTGTAAQFKFPRGLCVDSAGNVYVADTGNNMVRMISSAGVVTTFAGSIEGTADGTGTGAQFNAPYSIAIDASGVLYVSDTNNHAIRKITTGGVVTTLAGLKGTPGSADGNGTSARFNFPGGLAIDGAGNLLIADTGNSTIRRIDSSGNVTTIGGMALRHGHSSGTSAAARFYSPASIAVSNSGNIYVADNVHDGSVLVQGSLALAETAGVAASPGSVGAVSQFNVAPELATNRSWTIIRRPYLSTAELSSSTAANPQLTPDVADTYIVRLTASDGTLSSITTVALDVLPSGGIPFAPTLLHATAQSTNDVALSWASSPGVTTFEVARASATSPLAVIATPSSTSYTDATVASGSGYVYRVRALGTGGTSEYSDGDVANTVTFTNDPLVAGSTLIARAHIAELRTLIDEYRLAAGLTVQSWTDDPITPGTTVMKAAHISELRTALGEALTAIGIATPSFTSIGPGTPIATTHITEIRTATK